MSTRQQLASDSQISNPLVQASLLGRYWSTPTRVAQMRLVLSVGRPESMAAA